jgi:glutathione synthase/RimK-type ligase-like ATP-grasp enzyme
MNKILIVIPYLSNKSDVLAKRRSFVEAIKNHLGNKIQIEMASLSNMIFDISNDGCRVINSDSGVDVADYDFVIIRNVGKRIESGIALAHYLAMKGVAFTDGYLETQGSSKLACSMLQRRYGISIPRTIFASRKKLVEYVEGSSLNYPIVLKSNHGKKGRDNYLVGTSRELAEKLSLQPDVQFIAQEYIDNDGYYRALVINNNISVVIKRSPKYEDSVLKNARSVAPARLVPLKEFDSKLRRDIIKAAKLEHLQVAGIDIIFDRATLKWYFLEVNRAPQIDTGTFIDKKIAAYAKMIADVVARSEL